VHDLEERMKKQALRADEVAARWRLKRDDVQKQLDEAGEVMAAKDATIAQHKRLMKEYQSVLEASRDPPPPRTRPTSPHLNLPERFVGSRARCSELRAGPLQVLQRAGGPDLAFRRITPEA